MDNELILALRVQEIIAEYRYETGSYSLTNAAVDDWQYPIILLTKTVADKTSYELWDVGGLEAALRLAGQNENIASIHAAAQAAALGFNYRHGVRWTVERVDQIAPVYHAMIGLIAQVAGAYPEKP